MVALLLVSVAFLSGVTAAVPGCGSVGAIKEADTSFTPWEGRFGYSQERPMQRIGSPVSDAALTSLLPFVPAVAQMSRPLQAQFVMNVDDLDGDGVAEPALVRYYSADPWSSELTFYQFVVGGGIILREQTPAGMDGAYTESAVGSRATMIEVGPHKAALVHADPISAQEERPYYLTWSDGERDVQIVALLSASEIVDLARTVYCASDGRTYTG